MPIPIENHVKQILEKLDREKKLLEAIRHGWISRTNHPGNNQWRRKSTRAHVVWEAATQKAIELFADDSGVRVIQHYDTLSYVFDDAVLLRFKKTGLTLRSSNIQTTLSSLFHDHKSDLFGHQGLQRVEACYVLNRWESEIVWAGIVARENKAHLWHFELDTPDADAIVLPFQSAPRAAPADLAKIKKDKTAQPETKTEQKDN